MKNRILWNPSITSLKRSNIYSFQEKINKELVKIGDSLSLPLVATNNCHYLDREDFHAHEILLCLQTGKTMSDQYRMRYPSDEYYFKSPEEMMQ